MGATPARDAVLTAYVQSLIQFKARQICKKKGFSRSDEQDLAQELILRVLQKAPQYDPGRGASNTFAARVVESSVKVILRERRRLKRSAGFTAVSLDAPAVANGGLSWGMTLREEDGRRRHGTQLPGACHAQDAEAFATALRQMPAELAVVAQRLMQGNVASVARELGTSRIARPTASLNLHLQMIGRVMRASEGKTAAIVLDHAGNHHVHGLVTRPLTYSLDGSTRVGHDEPIGIRRCQDCGLIFDSALPACPECGWTLPPPEREAPHIHGTGELSEFDDSSFEYRQQVWNLIEAEREAMGYREGWSSYRFNERFGVMPIVAGNELIDPRHATLDQKRIVFEHFTQIAQDKGFKAGWASHRFKQAFGHWPRGFVSAVRANHISQRWREATA
jgi:RNA polymerase sigma-70 factor (ECF subfamily)